MSGRVQQDVHGFQDLRDGHVNLANPCNPVADEVSELTDKVIGCALSVHSELGPGYLEKVYENAMVAALGEAGVRVRQQVSVKATCHGAVVGDFIADLLVDGWFIVELKAVAGLAAAHEVQLVSYLKATNCELGLLINFGATSLQFKRKYKVGRRKQDFPDCQELRDVHVDSGDPANSVG